MLSPDMVTPKSAFSGTSFPTSISSEVFFYAFIEGKAIQCFELAEQDKLDENELDSAFELIVNIIKESEFYKSDRNNIATIAVDKSGVNMNMEYYEKDAHMYKIKKEWEKKVMLWP